MKLNVSMAAAILAYCASSIVAHPFADADADPYNSMDRFWRAHKLTKEYEPKMMAKNERRDADPFNTMKEFFKANQRKKEYERKMAAKNERRDVYLVSDDEGLSKRDFYAVEDGQELSERDLELVADVLSKRDFYVVEDY
jgi:hypothetical protein